MVGRSTPAPARTTDLFWGLRGGGGNFGIVTSFEFRLHPVGPNVLIRAMVFPFDRGEIGPYAICPLYRDDAGRTQCLDGHAQGASAAIPLREVHGKESLRSRVCYVGNPAEGETLIDPLRGFGQAHGEHIGSSRSPPGNRPSIRF